MEWYEVVGVMFASLILVYIGWAMGKDKDGEG
jgi:hypothetical protein